MTAKELRDLRLSLDLTQGKFAALIGMSRWTVVTSERIGPSRFVEAAIYRAMGEGKLQPSDKPRDRRHWPRGG
jgi:transcriptional regulator with XRE-family HTH domain